MLQEAVIIDYLKNGVEELTEVIQPYQVIYKGNQNKLFLQQNDFEPRL